MEMEEIMPLRALLFENKRRLEVLEIKATRLGINTPPEIVTEMEDIRQIITSLEERIAHLEQNPDNDSAEISSSITGRFINLPNLLTPLIDREIEVARARELLERADVRLITLTGPGGTGKTRLGVQIAKELSDLFKDGVCFVGLASIGDFNLVPSAIAQALRIKEISGQQLIERIKKYLKDKHTLLVLDNFEHVVDAAPLVVELLETESQLNVLVTSRAVLKLNGEYQVDVPPLGLPNPAVLPIAEDDVAAALSQFAAVQLFIQRAQAIDASFQVTATNAPAIAEICVRVDGLPLAIELAAARVRLLPPEMLLERLKSRLDLLTGGGGDPSDRQRTLRNTIGWSYDLLNATEQALFARLAAFAGGWTLEAAEFVCDLDDMPTYILDGLSSLLDKSLIYQVGTAHGVRHWAMLETIGEYALERLTERGEEEALRQRHAEYYLMLAERGERELRGSNQEQWLEWWAAEHDNLRAALVWAHGRGDINVGLRLGGALGRFWFVRGDWNEGRRWLESGLESTTSVAPTIRIKALNALGTLMRHQGDYAMARAWHEESLAISRGLNDKQNIADALRGLGDVALWQDNLEQAKEYLEEGLALFREVGDTWGTAWSRCTLGEVLREQRSYEQATAHFGESLALFRKLGDTWQIAWSLHDLGELELLRGNNERALELTQTSLVRFRKLGAKIGMAWSLHNLGYVARHQHNTAEAVAHLHESLGLFQELQVKDGVVNCLAGLAAIFGLEGQPDRAARLFGVVKAVNDATPLRLAPVTRTEYDRNMGATRSRRDRERWAAAFAEGQKMSLEQAIAEALQGRIREAST